MWDLVAALAFFIGFIWTAVVTGSYFIRNWSNIYGQLIAATVQHRYTFRPIHPALPSTDFTFNG